MGTVAECNNKAKALCAGGYRYLYGAKGQLYTKQLVESLAKQYKSNYSAAIKKEALKDADKGFRAGDCSYFVCTVLGLSMINSLAIKQKAVELLKPDKKNAKEGMALWKNGHVAYIGEGLKVYEFKSTAADACVSTFESRAKDFTYMFVVKGTALDQELQAKNVDQVIESKMYYPKYTGKSNSIVDALATVGEKDISFNHRRKIAQKNGYQNYEGSIKQNNQLLALIKAGKLIRA